MILCWTMLHAVDLGHATPCQATYDTRLSLGECMQIFGWFLGECMQKLTLKPYEIWGVKPTLMNASVGKAPFHILKTHKGMQ